MNTASPSQIMQMLIAWNKGDVDALAQLTPLVHDELRRIAECHMAGERSAHMLQPTALVYEAYKNRRSRKSADLVAVDDALKKLAELDARQVRVVE